ncbi:MAG TPA: DUF6084 family protein [Chthoniobacterales bacterium]|nr:DUF6084 family protein [Chthoniobacterales bacterium]
MPDLNFKVTGVQAAARGLTPLLQFNLEISNQPPTETIHAVMIQAQIQIQSAQRAYNDAERKGLEELFGTPDRWGQTLRNRLWTHASTTVPPFAGHTTVTLPVQCSYDFNVIGTKYFYALEGGEVPLLFLFNGTIFYAGPHGQLLVQQISWDKECVYRMPSEVWTNLMNHHYPNIAWLSIGRDILDKLTEFKREHGLLTWEQVFERLLNPSRGSDAKADLSRPSEAEAEPVAPKQAVEELSRASGAKAEPVAPKQAVEELSPGS